MTKDLHPVEALILIAMAVIWAVATVTRVIALALIAMVLALATRPQRRSAPPPVATPEPAAAEPLTLAPAATDATEPPLAVDLAAIRDRLMLQSAAEIRRITGSRRRCAKRDLVDAYLALPI